jgi:hypothetical protein
MVVIASSECGWSGQGGSMFPDAKGKLAGIYPRSGFP